ncbi:hypothetical protein [Methylorubrum extorquens]
MSMLPPENFITAVLLAVYSIGFVIHKETDMGFKEDAQSHLYSTSGIQATFVKGNGKQIPGQFRSISMYLFEDRQNSSNPFLRGGLGLTLAPIPDDKDIPVEFGEDWVSKNVESIWVPLQPPYHGCTSTDRTMNGATCTAYDRKSADIVNYIVHLLHVGEEIVAYMRQALASGRINSIIIEEE